MKLLYTLLLLMPLAAIAQTPGSLTIKKVADFDVKETPDKTWDAASWVEVPQRSDNGVTYATKAKVLYSETGIYFLFHCEDNKLTATMTQDFDDLFKEDVVEVFLWTDEKSPIYFEYELSPLNYELPILVPNYGGKFLGWRPWHYFNERRTKHVTTVEGGPKRSNADIKAWTAQFFIPYVLLNPLQNVPPTGGTKWRANMYRLDYDSGKATRWEWQPIRTNFHDYERYGTFVFE
ncbi:MAG: carbohydrate-binding family 9-like protein [Imperialibacter sp.]|uniref:carbohydrate-binding family 9-like protein n=1 Tax=Imperialibacter sp. TaxID=2038411 RepID=UPI0032ED03EB